MTAKSYDPNTPQFREDSFAITQPQLQANFQALFNAFAVNHVSITASSNAGNHNVIELLSQINSIQTDVSEINIYTKEVEGQTEQVFFRYQGNGQEFQFTNYQIYSIPDSKTQTQFFTFLPGRVIIYFGSFTTLPKGVLTLLPSIAKNIIGMTFCPFGPVTKTTFPASVTIPPAKDGIFTKIITSNTVGITAPGGATNMFYIILANT